MSALDAIGRCCAQPACGGRVTLRPPCRAVDLGDRADADRSARRDRARQQRRGLALHLPVDPSQGERHHVRAARARRGLDLDRRRRHGMARGRLRFPVAALLLLGAGAAACGAALSRGLRLCRVLPLHRAGAGTCPLDLRLRDDPRLLVPRHTLDRRCGLRHGVGALSLRLSHHPHRLPDAGPQHRRRRTHARRLALEGVLARAAAGGAAGHRRRRRAGADGDDQRHRRERISRRAHAHRFHLLDLAQPRQPGRRRGNRA